MIPLLVLIARVASIVNYDRILLLDAGHIKEFAPPQELLSDPGSRFARLAATQKIYADPTACEEVNWAEMLVQ